MNAEAHLRAQGWQGPGTGFREGSIKRAILTSKKIDQKGLGTKSSESDQWWDNIFSKQLSNIAVGLNGQVSQVNGGIKAAHPVAARHAHRRQFGEKSALEKVFRMGEVLKGSESMIPPALEPAVVTSDRLDAPRDAPMECTPKQKSANNKKKRKLKESQASKSKTNCRKEELDTRTVNALSDKQIRKEMKRLRREERALKRARRRAKEEKRQVKTKSIATQTKDT